MRDIEMESGTYSHFQGNFSVMQFLSICPVPRMETDMLCGTQFNGLPTDPTLPPLKLSLTVYIALTYL